MPMEMTLARAKDPVAPGFPSFELRGLRVVLDADPARLFGVETKRLNEQLRRNLCDSRATAPSCPVLDLLETAR